MRPLGPAPPMPKSGENSLVRTTQEDDPIVIQPVSEMVRSGLAVDTFFRIPSQDNALVRVLEEDLPENLVGRLHAKVGDLILVKNIIGPNTVISKSILDIAGYVVKYDRNRLTISHENPLSSHYEASECEYRTSFWDDGIGSSGRRKYNLDHFNQFEVLKEAEEEDALNWNEKARQTLLGRLLVQIGDLVRIRSGYLDIAGYVLESDREEVALSYENPLTLYANSASNHFFRSDWTRGIRTYNLRKFRECEVLQEAGKDTSIKEK